MKTVTLSEKQTLNLGKKITKQLKGGETIALIGELGAGKTIFAKGIADGLGVKKIITSPTFVLMKIYPVKQKKNEIKTLCHADAYRLISGKDLINIGIDDYLGQKNTITIIEWADRIKKILPLSTIFVKIKVGDEKNKRIIAITKIKTKNKTKSCQIKKIAL